MSEEMRLDVMPMTGLPQIILSDGEEPHVTTLNCVLRSNLLPADQCLEVRVNGVVQQSVEEGERLVFSWQLVRPSDEVRVNLFSREVVMRHWRGHWDGRESIVCRGTLPIQIFFNGKRQAAAQEEESNGYYQLDGRIGEQSEHGDVVAIQDLLVMAEARPSSTDRRESAQETELVMEQATGEMAEELRQGVPEEADASPDKVDEGREDGECGSLVEPETLQVEAGGVTASGPRLAAFHADPFAPEKTLEALKALVATMPAKTILIDLRHHSHGTKRKYQEQDGLSKERLRAIFGGIYWDRGWAIQTTHRHHAPAESHVSRWQRVLVDPDRSPDGIPSFVKHLQEGYSLVVMDSQASYEGSVRRAVIEELQKQCPNLVVDPVQ